MLDDPLFWARQRENHLLLKLLNAKADRILAAVEVPTIPTSRRSASGATVMPTATWWRSASLKRVGVRILQWALGRLAELLLPSLLVIAGLAWRYLGLLWRAIVG